MEKYRNNTRPAVTFDLGLEPYDGPWEIPQLTHLLRRLLFGASWEDIQFFLRQSPLETVAHLLSPPAEAPPPPINDYNKTDPDVAWGESWANAPRNNEFEGPRIWSLKCWWMGNILEQDRSIMEKMIVFWHNHIPIEFYAVFYSRRNYRYLTTIREHALGNFRQLVRAITLDPAMLQYLNGQSNRVGAPDENYARELQELFCIGKGPDAAYTEEDVQAAARVLTGWRADWETDEVYFKPEAHDSADKKFSSFYNDAFIKGKKGEEGARELDELLDIIFANPECSLFLCRKLYRFFVYHEIDNLTEEMIIQPLAEIMRENDYEILPVLEALFSSRHFFAHVKTGALIKSPLDFLAGLYREFKTPVPPRSAILDRYQHNGHVFYQSAINTQAIGDPPNVAGWPAYYQIPNFDKTWITTSTLPRRAQFIDWVLHAGISTENFHSQLDVLGIVEQIPNSQDVDALVDGALAWLYSIEVSDAFKVRLKETLLSGQVSEYYWRDAWLSYLDNPSNEMQRNVVRNRLKGFFHTLLHQAEYHLR